MKKFVKYNVRQCVGCLLMAVTAIGLIVCSEYGNREVMDNSSDVTGMSYAENMEVYTVVSGDDETHVVQINRISYETPSTVYWSADEAPEGYEKVSEYDRELDNNCEVHVETYELK